ncbi:MAG: putative tautomerase, partial [Candidatus Eremiobacteraeota bacterium]|nr:putative tautomerase [Candidatus Eremiobacteraeota bacterium]
MPLVRITARDSRSNAVLDALGDAVHTELVETMGVPPDDRFQIRSRVPAEELVADPKYLGIERRDPVIVEISLRAGRTVELKRAFYARVVELAGVRPEDVMIVLNENGPADWSFGNGIA